MKATRIGAALLESVGTYEPAPILPRNPALAKTFRISPTVLRNVAKSGGQDHYLARAELTISLGKDLRFAAVLGSSVPRRG